MSALHNLVEQQVKASTTTTLSRAIDRFAEELAEDLLRDTEWRNKMRDLVRAAFEKALTELQA